MDKASLIAAQIDVADIRPLRLRVLRAGLPSESAIFPGDDHPQAVHFAIRRDAIVIGCATVVPESINNKPGWRLRGMAVDPQFQKLGLGRKLLAAVHQYVDQSDNHFLWCYAREPAIPFYLRNGWKVTSDIFDIPTAGPHVVMLYGGSSNDALPHDRSPT